MPWVTFRSPAVTDVTAGSAARVVTVPLGKACMGVPVVGALYIVPTRGASSLARTGRGPPAESLHPETTAGRSYSSFGPFSFSSFF
ncbi:hypothetical protein ACGFIW_17170 [Micromonospora sp. NPDC048935]|uniref:hypothetical protein n=1 Tax=Micromonospora sp. NPDC048935 TaxID=3364262 RepID=UPI003713DA22